jgi:hypothetical protein
MAAGNPFHFDVDGGSYTRHGGCGLYTKALLQETTPRACGTQ